MMRNILLFLLLFLTPAPIFALEGAITVKSIEVKADFSGATLTVFGALERDKKNGDRIQILIKGPKRNLALWEKERVAGIWVNSNKKQFNNIPSFYFLLSSDETISQTKILKGLETKEREAVEEQLVKRNLFFVKKNGVEFLGKRLFKAKVKLPTTAPIGDYMVHIKLFNKANLAKQLDLELQLHKTGWGHLIFFLAQEWAFFYGILAVSLALFLGWTMTELLRRIF